MSGPARPTAEQLVPGVVWSADRIAAVTGGRVTHGGPAARRIVTDSRLVRSGDCFVALAGGQRDGHAFVADAFARGAAGVLVSAGATPAPVAPSGGFVVAVADPADALAKLAQEHRRLHASVRVFGITGSCGKTTTKDMLGAVLEKSMATVVAPKSFNNWLGVPLTLLELEPATRAAVLELGSSGPGEIERLAAIAKPDVGIVTCVGASHLEGLADLDGVAAEKGRLIAALPEAGIAVLNAGDPRVRAMGSLTRARKVWVRVGEEADWFATSVRCYDDHTSFLLQGKRSVTLPRVGAHHVVDALLAIAAASAVGVRVSQSIAVLKELPATEHRMQRHRRGDVVVIDDTYNMNPTSARAALAALRDLPAGGRKVAVLGGMLELGAQSQALHHELGAAAAAGQLDLLLTVGPQAQAIGAGAVAAGMAPSRVVAVAGSDDALAQLMATLGPGDRVLCKASRRMELDRLVDRLLTELAAREPEGSR